MCPPPGVLGRGRRTAIHTTWQTDDRLNGIVLLDQIGSLLKLSPETVTFQCHYRYRENGLRIAPGHTDSHLADVESQPSPRAHVAPRSHELAGDRRQGGVDLANVLSASLREGTYLPAPLLRADIPIDTTKEPDGVAHGGRWAGGRDNGW